MDRAGGAMKAWSIAAPLVGSNGRKLPPIPEIMLDSGVGTGYK